MAILPKSLALRRHLIGAGIDPSYQMTITSLSDWTLSALSYLWPDSRPIPTFSFMDVQKNLVTNPPRPSPPPHLLNQGWRRIYSPFLFSLLCSARRSKPLLSSLFFSDWPNKLYMKTLFNLATPRTVQYPPVTTRTTAKVQKLCRSMTWLNVAASFASCAFRYVVFIYRNQLPL